MWPAAGCKPAVPGASIGTEWPIPGPTRRRRAQDFPAPVLPGGGGAEGAGHTAPVLIHFIRVLFVIFAVLVGTTNGRKYYPEWMVDVPPWFGAIMGFAIAVTLIASEQAFKKRFTRSLVALLIGIAGGLLLSLLILYVIRFALPLEQGLFSVIGLPVVLVVTYLVLITVLRNADRFRLVVPFVEFRAETRSHAGLVVAPELLADSRFIGLLRAGFTSERLIVHAAVIAQWSALASSAEPVEQVRARRALDGLAELRALGLPAVEVAESEIPNSASLGETLIRLARLESARLASTDRDLLQRARAHGVAVVDVGGLAGAAAITVRPGEEITVLIDKTGETPTQGTGRLDDGSLVVVTDAGAQVGKEIRCTVLRLHASANGRMVFAKYVAPPDNVLAPTPSDTAGRLPAV